jgi:N-acetylmuramoyl-L-alanine amidase
VKQIQKKVGCYPDGIWGRLTTEAVKNWQREKGLTADGIAGPRTLAAMGIEAMTPKTGASSAALSQVTACYGGKTITLKRSKRRIDEIIVHCTATPEGRDLTVEQIRQDHIKNNHWSDIGYQYVVYRDGTVHLGRDVDISGAHADGHNSHSIGVVYVGGVENRPGVPYTQLKAKDTRTEQQKASLLALLMDLRKLYPKARIIGHRDVDTHGKECPSFKAKEEYRNI